MNMFEFNRRGFICALNRNMTVQEVEELSRKEFVIYKALQKLDAKYFVVMKRISETMMLVAPVFVSQRKKCKKIRINQREYWVNFMSFYAVPEKLFEAAPGKYLDYSYKTISEIYTSHNNVLKEKWRRANEKEMIEQELRRCARDRKRNARRYDMSHLYPGIPQYVQQGARHPYGGGMMSPR